SGSGSGVAPPVPERTAVRLGGSWRPGPAGAVAATRVADPVRASRIPLPTRCPYVSVTTQRETPRESASVRLGGSAVPGASRPEATASSSASSRRWRSVPGPGASATSTSAADGELVWSGGTTLDRSTRPILFYRGGHRARETPAAPVRRRR